MNWIKDHAGDLYRIFALSALILVVSLLAIENREKPIDTDPLYVTKIVLKIQEYDKKVSSLPPSEEIDEISKEIAKLGFVIDDICTNEGFKDYACYFFATREKVNPFVTIDRTRRDLYVDFFNKQAEKVSNLLSVFNNRHRITSDEQQSI